MLYKQLCCFLEVANVLSFTTAAHNLYMSQQAVTKQIAALERELGFKLFNRSTRSVALTPAGRMLRDDFAVLQRQLNASIKKAKDLAGVKQSCVTVGFLSLLSQPSVILPITRQLFRAFPDIYFEIRMLDFVALRNQLLDGQLDLVVTTSNDWKLWPDVKVDVLQSKPFEIVFSTRHPLARREPFDLECLRDYTQLTLPRDNMLPGVEEWARKLPFSRSILCPDLATVRVYLESGQGFSLLTRVFEGCESETLTYRPVPFPEAHAELVCIRRQSASSELGRLVQCIKEVIH